MYRSNARSAIALLAFLIHFLSTVYCAVHVQTPIASQLPAIARVGQPYSWTFSPSTFSEDNSTAPLRYDVQGLPTWASFDEVSRTFSGTPPANTTQSRVNAHLNITASNVAGENATDNFPLITMIGRGPVVNKPLAQQLPNVTTLDGDTILPSGAQLLPLGWSFSLGFAGDSFTSDSHQVYLSAALADGSDLPGWLHFDQTVTFWGNAPTDIKTAGSFYTVVVTASDVRGYAGVNSSFELVVSGASLVQDAPFPSINATAGQPLQYTVRLDNIVNSQRDTVNATQVIVSANTTSIPWLTFDAESRAFSGTPPFTLAQEQAQTLTIPITLATSPNVTVPTSLNLSVYPSAFTVQDPPDLNVKPGQLFHVDLGQFLRPSTSSLNLTYDPASASDWISYDANQMALSGTVPEGKAESVKVILTSPVDDGAYRSFSTSSFTISPQDSAATVTSAAAAGRPARSTSSSADSSQGELSNAPSSPSGLSSKSKIAIAVSLGGAGGLAMMIFIMMCCRRFCAAEDRKFRGYTGNEGGSDCEKWYAGNDDDRTLADERSPRFGWVSSMDKKDKGKKHTDALSPYLSDRLRGAEFNADKSPFSDAMTLAASEEHHGEVNPRQIVTTGNVAPMLAAPAFMITNPSPVNEKPKRSSVLNFFNKKSKSSNSVTAALSQPSQLGDNTHGPSIGLGLEGMGNREMSQMTTAKSAARSIARSSWESNLFYDETMDRPSTPERSGAMLQGESLSLDSPLEVPVRRNHFGPPMRHRNSHINTSPAFDLNAGFESSPERDDDDYPAQSRNSTALAHHGHNLSVDLDDAIVGIARKVQVEPSGTVKPPQQVSIQQGQRNLSQHLDALSRLSHGTNSAAVEDDPFEDAEDQPNETSEEDQTRANTKRNSASSYVPNLDGAELNAVRYTDYRRSSTRALQINDGIVSTPVSTRTRIQADSEGLSLRAVPASKVPLPPTPVIPGFGPSTPSRSVPSQPGVLPAGIKSNPFVTPSSTKRPSSFSSSHHSTNGPVSTWNKIKCHTLSVLPGEMVRVSALSGTAAPPMVGGAPGSPGKRSGRRLTYHPVLQDEKFLEYYNTWPEFLQWLSWDSRMQELSGTVPFKFGPTPLTLKLAIIAKSSANGATPPSPSLGGPSGSRDSSPAKLGHNRTSSVASANSNGGQTSEEEVVATVVLNIRKLLGRP